MRIAHVNLAYDAGATNAADLLARLPTLTAWSRAMAEAGAEVVTVQRWRTNGGETRDGVRYALVGDTGPPVPRPWHPVRPVVAAVARTRPDVVHVNGLGFPRHLHVLRKMLGASPVIVVQDHGGVRPPDVRGGRGMLRRLAWRRGFDAVDAVSFTAEGQAGPWREAGLLDTAHPVLAICEASTTIASWARHEARTRTGMRGTPAFLSVGRLVEDKDPLTLLSALEAVLPGLPGARAYFIFQGGPLEDAVRRRVAGSAILRQQVELCGAVAHAAIADWFSGADLFLSASRREGSGYALIEAMACGLRPVVTAIPSFRAIADDEGVYFPVGDVTACADACRRAASWLTETTRASVRARFDRALAWPVLAGETLRAYRALLERRRGAS